MVESLTPIQQFLRGTIRFDAVPSAEQLKFVTLISDKLIETGEVSQQMSRDQLIEFFLSGGAQLIGVFGAMPQEWRDLPDEYLTLVLIALGVYEL
jgi:hypothetical protein